MSVENYPEIVMPQCQAERILKGQKALVTGGGSGIGKAVAIELGKAGADVMVNYVRGDDQAQEVVAEIEKSDSRAFAHQAAIAVENFQLHRRMLASHRKMTIPCPLRWKLPRVRGTPSTDWLASVSRAK